MSARLIAARRISYCPSCMPVSDPLSVMNRLFCGWVVRDRFNYLNHYLPFRMADIKDEVPTPDNSLTLAQICDAKAKEIIALGVPITVSWSGGVDSTAVVTSLLKNGIDKDSLTILHAPSSKVEYPWMYKHLQDLGIRLKETEAVASAYDEVTEGVIVSGWCADQLFGSNIHLRNLDLYNLPWIDGVRQAMKDRFIRLSDRSFDVLAEVWNGYAEHVGLKVEQFCEFAWLYNFGVKWSYVSEDAKMAAVKPETRSRIVNFFEDIRFQRWSMAQFGSIRETNVNRFTKFYKRPLKHYIYEYTEDPDYLLRKGKVNSWALVKDKTDYGVVSVLDTDGYHVFRLKGNPDNPDLSGLRKAVAQRYLKEEF